MITLKYLLEMKRKLESLPAPEYDVMVCTEELYNSIPRDIVTGPNPAARFFGMPVYIVADDIHAKTMAMKLSTEGKNPVILTQEDVDEIPQ